MTKVYLVRHGETEWNSARRIQGRTDIGLSAWGQAQAQRLNQRFRETHLDRVYSSPLLRARQTAEEIVAGRPLTVSFDGALAERSLGEWEGLLFNEIEARFPEERKEWLANPWFAPTGGESLIEVRDRAWGVWQRAVGGPPDSAVLLVTHAYVAQMLLGIASGLPRETTWASYPFRVLNASVSVIDVSPKPNGQDGGEAQVVMLNDLSHLEDLPSVIS